MVPQMDTQTYYKTMRVDIQTEFVLKSIDIKLYGVTR